MRSRSRLWILFAAMVFLVASAVTFGSLGGSYVVPLDSPAIQYYSSYADDPVERLDQKIARGEVHLKFDGAQGYLRSVLQQLNISVQSQMLVFSKTSFQAPLISPRLPRALYFNDATAVGFVHSSNLLEFASVDPKLGVVFYTLEQKQTDKPHFQRHNDDCLECHHSGKTLGVPGLLMRSVYTDPSGLPISRAGDFVTDHRSPLNERWGGWYVTATHGAAGHMGNAVVPDPAQPDKLDSTATFRLANLRGKIETDGYLTPYSDIVALMTLAHQTRMTNLITRVSYETNMALGFQAMMNRSFHEPSGEMSDGTRSRIDSAAEEMVQYMLFLDEARLDAPIEGNSGFTEAFEKIGPRDRRGRSLRDFDLKKRLFRYPLSYMIYSEAFDKMPLPARDRIYQLLFDILTGKDQSPRYANLTATDRKAIFEIMVDTKKDLPAYWRR